MISVVFSGMSRYTRAAHGFHPDQTTPIMLKHFFAKRAAQIPLHTGTFRQQLRQHLKLLLAIGALLTLIELINLLTLRSLNVLALVPRQPQRLLTLFTAPLLHKDLWHFFSNIVPFLVLSLLTLQQGRTTYQRVLLCGVLIPGLLVWLLARPVPHLGLNGVIYCQFGFLIVSALRTRELKHLLLALIALFAHGSLALGLLPVNAYVSWESNLAGLLAGGLCAFWLHRLARREVILEA